MPPPGDARFPTAGAYFAGAVGFAAFAAYASLLPFEFHRVSFGEALEQFRAILAAPLPSRLSRSDVIANILLFVPVGFTLAGTLLVDRARWLWLAPFSAAAILLFSSAVSLTIEFLQIFASGRVSSRVDIAAQIVGCVIGIGAWLVAGQPLTNWLRATFASAPEGRLSRLLTAFAVAWVFANLAPFDITVDVGELGSRLRSGRINLIPFGGAPMSLAARLWDSVAEILGAIPLGALGVVGWSGRTGRSVVAATAFGIVLVGGVELAQVFLASHSADVTDALLGSAGIAVGVVLASRIRRDAGAPIEAPAGRLISPVAAGAFVGWCLVLLMYHWSPYDFSLDGEAIRRKLGAISLLPFAGHRGGSDLNALQDVIVTLALAMPLGIAGSFLFRRPGRLPLAHLAVLGMSAGVVGFVEAGQLFLPTRTPDPTDVMVGGAGTAIGIALGRWLRADPLAPAGRRYKGRTPSGDTDAAPGAAGHSATSTGHELNG